MTIIMAIKINKVLDFTKNAFLDLEAKILSEQRKVLLRNAFLGKFNRDDIRQVDNAIEKVKEAKVETEKALDVSIMYCTVGTPNKRIYPDLTYNSKNGQ